MTSIAPLPDLDAIPALPVPVAASGSRILGYRRTPRDIFRTVVYAVITLLLLVPTLWTKDAILGFERDVIDLVTFLHPSAERISVGVLQILVAVVLIGVWVTPLVTKRFRLFGYLVVANVLAAGLAVAIEISLGGERSDELRNVIARRAGISSLGFPALWTLAMLAAVFVVLSPFVTRRWRSLGVGTFIVIVVLRLVTSVDLPATLFLSLALGGTAGALVLYLFGRPDERPTDDAVLASLRAAGLSIAALDPADVDARGSTPYFGTFTDGEGLFAKVLGTEERSADLLFRVYRYLRFRNLGDERPFSSLRRSVEHEAFVALQARDVGVVTPRMRAVATVGDDCFLLAYDRIEGTELDRLDADRIDETLLRRVWEQVALLRKHRIAHRDLRLANVVVDDHNEPWIIDFGFAEVAASDALLEADIAQVSSSLSVLAGVDAAIDAGIAVLGPEPFAAALPRLQMGALSGATQTALRHHRGLLHQLQQTIEARTGVTEVKFEPIQRLQWKQLFTVLMLVGVTYFLLPQFADLPEVWDHVKDATWAWFIPVLVASAFTYIGATLGLMGSIPDRLQLLPTFVTQVASSFVSKVAPAGLGGMALNVRFAQKSGVDSAVAVSGVGLNTVGGLLVHVLLLVLFVVWAGRSAFGAVKLPDPIFLLYGLIAVLAFAGVAFAVPAVRKLVIGKLFPILRRSVGAIAAVMRNPAKVVLLFGGSAIVTLGNVFALYFATKAFGGDLRFATVGAAFVAGATVASVAPTPGGLGAMEAALVAGLTAAGMPGSIALPSVFLFRFGTFWLPILPGWASFSWLKHTEHI